VPLNIIALSTLPRHILTQGTAIRSLMRISAAAIGISILVATLAENTQIVHSRLVESLRPTIRWLRRRFCRRRQPDDAGGLAALNAG